MKDKIRYVIVDDEPIAHRILEDMASKLDDLHKVGNAYNPMEALEILRKTRVDLIFLDVQIPHMTGFEFLKILKDPPQVIVTSAYESFALEGYEHNVVDYLLKPFREARLLQAVQKIKVPGKGPQQNEGKILLKGDQLHYVDSLEILYVEACGNYCLVHLKEQTVMVSEKISNLETDWDYFGMVRCHKSYLVPKHHIKSIHKDKVAIGEHKIPIGRTYKRPFLNSLKQ